MVRCKGAGKVHNCFVKGSSYSMAGNVAGWLKPRYRPVASLVSYHESLQIQYGGHQIVNLCLHNKHI